jgi:hypothetical protein
MRLLDAAAVDDVRAAWDLLPLACDELLALAAAKLAAEQEAIDHDGPSRYLTTFSMCTDEYNVEPGVFRRSRPDRRGRSEHIEKKRQEV